MSEEKNEGIAFLSNFLSTKQQVLKKKLGESVKILIDLLKREMVKGTDSSLHKLDRQLCTGITVNFYKY